MKNELPVDYLASEGRETALAVVLRRPSTAATISRQISNVIKCDVRESIPSDKTIGPSRNNFIKHRPQRSPKLPPCSFPLSDTLSTRTPLGRANGVRPFDLTKLPFTHGGLISKHK